MTTDTPVTPSSDADSSDGNDRVLSLSDGVFGFAMTLLITTIDPPDANLIGSTEVARAVREQLPHFYSFVLSFLVIGLLWMAHHRIFRELRGHDRGLLWLNIFFLLCIVFLPYPTNLIGEYDNQFVVVFYAASMTVTSFALTGLWWYASRNPRLTRITLTRQQFAYARSRGLLNPVVFLASIGLSYFSLDLARYSWTMIGIGHYLLARWYGDTST